MSNLTYLTDVWMITFVGAATGKRSENILLAARDAGAKGAFGYHVTGYGIRERFGALGVAVEAEKSNASVLVSSEQRDTVFEAMYKAGGLDAPGTGFLYMQPVERVAAYVPDSVLARLRKTGSARED
jgi:nitrogen regulatory protein P-II 1